MSEQRILIMNTTESMGILGSPNIVENLDFPASAPSSAAQIICIELSTSTSIIKRPFEGEGDEAVSIEKKIRLDDHISTIYGGFAPIMGVHATNLESGPPQEQKENANDAELVFITDRLTDNIAEEEVEDEEDDDDVSSIDTNFYMDAILYHSHPKVIDSNSEDTDEECGSDEDEDDEW